MKKYLFSFFCIVSLFSVAFSLKNNAKKNNMSKMLLANIEALAMGEGGNKSESKDSNTKQEGPYLVTIRGEEKYAYLVTTVTNCYGIGVVDCEPGIESKWVAVN